jgi:FixJ family two-component response regulator
MARAMKVAIVDDEADMRASISQWLALSGFDTETYASAEEALKVIGPEFPGVVVSDIKMPGMDGMAFLKRLMGMDSGLPVIMITGHGDVPMAVETMKKGAMDFIQKPFQEDALVSLVERMLDQAKDAFTEHQHSASRDALLAKLTSREAQVLERIVAGRLNKQIADDLGISIKTVEAHRANIMEKLNANTVADLLKIALGSTTAPKN